MTHSSARRTKPELWARIVKRVKSGSKGAKAGVWSAHKAQLAVSEYKKAGGGYVGRKSSSNSLVKWTKQDWGYVTPGKKSGRYLPRKVREHMSPREKARENRLKGSRRGVRVPYSRSVRAKVRKYTR